MKIPIVMVLIIGVTLLTLGVLVGLNVNREQVGEKPINLNPFPKTCEYNGKIYKSGDGFRSTDGCNTCGCQNGEVACTLMACE